LIKKKIPRETALEPKWLLRCCLPSLEIDPEKALSCQTLLAGYVKLSKKKKLRRMYFLGIIMTLFIQTIIKKKYCEKNF